MLGVEMLDDHESQAAVSRHMTQETLDRLEPTG
jgi:hypothetical protein